MSLIDVQNLTFEYDGGFQPIFENVSFQINTDWKLGFVGRNGRGKTTFLNLLAGKYEYKGKISSSVKFTYFPFEVKDKGRLAYDIIFSVCPEAEDWQIIRELAYLDMDAEALYRPFSSLSNGEQTKLLLAGLFLNEGGFLLIDEPTNHLDIDARKTVSQYLKSKKGFILVSHDRAFLDGCVDHILSINRTDIEVQSGNFSSWLENFERRQAFELAQNERLQKDISRLEQSAKRTSAWADKTEASKFGKADSGLKKDRGYVGHKSAKMMQRAKSVQVRRQREIERTGELLLNTETFEKLKISPLVSRTGRLVEVSNLRIFYGEREICKPVSFQVMAGERIALHGKNGCGKSSLLKLIVGEDITHTGIVKTASGLVISYVPQSAEHICGKLSDFAKQNQIEESLFKAILAKMDFNEKHFDCDIASYSEGQKKKVLIAASLCRRADLYVWDEPLNYIDIYTRLQIENLIKEYSPAMVFVEHDKAFRDAVATRVIEL